MVVGSVAAPMMKKKENSAARNLVDVYGMADHRLVELEASLAIERTTTREEWPYLAW